jgi:hypothetical protein
MKRNMQLDLIEENVPVERMLGEFYGNPRSTAGFDEFTLLVETTLHASVHAGLGYLNRILIFIAVTCRSHRMPVTIPFSICFIGITYHVLSI